MNTRDANGRQLYTVKQVADLSGVTIRTLHHYDQIGILPPSGRTEKGYRLYSRDDLLVLQQILFYRELDFRLEQISELLDDPEYDTVTALEQQRQRLVQQRKHMWELIQTLDRTLADLQGEVQMSLSDKELYEGFDQEKIDRWNREVDEQYDPKVVAESRRKVGKMSKDQFKAVQQEGEDVTDAIGEKMDLGADAAEVQTLIARHHAWIENFYACSAEMYKGLGQLYIQNPEFTAYYEKFKPGLAQFMSEAMAVFADKNLKTQ